MSSKASFLESLVGHKDMVTESYSDISIFLSESETYLDGIYNKNKSGDPDAAYTLPISSGGEVTMSIMKACKDLISVKAFTEALFIYQTYLDRLEDLKENLKQDDIMVIQDTIGCIQGEILNTVKERDDFYSNRKSILARYSGIIKKK